MKIDVTVLVALIAALAAIIAPVVTALINYKQSMKLKKLEMLESNLYSSISDLAKGYSELIDNSGYLEPYWAFHTSAYKVMAQIPNRSIQKRLVDLLAKIRENNGRATDETNRMFDAFILEISNYLSDI